MTSFDVQAARYCARVVADHYRHIKVPLPPQLQEHLLQLENHNSSVTGTETQSSAAQSDHDLVGTVEAADILRCSREYVCRIATDLDGQLVAGRWLFQRHTVTEYANAKSQRT